jgi:hypothetical protein
VPLARGGDVFREVSARIAAVAFLALVAALVRGWPSLVPVSMALVGGAYAAELAIDDAPLDLAAPTVAVGLLLAAELAYWSLDERSRTPGDRGQGLHRAALVAVGALGAFALGTALLAVVADLETGGFALDLAGALAAVAVVLAVLATARNQSSRGK